MALVVISALMFFGLAAVRMTISSNRTTVASNDDREAMALAEAGLSEAMDAVRAGSSGQLGAMNWPVTMGEGLFWVDATDLGNSRIQLVATGMLGSGRSARGRTCSIRATLWSRCSSCSKAGSSWSGTRKTETRSLSSGQVRARFSPRLRASRSDITAMRLRWQPRGCG